MRLTQFKAMFLKRFLNSKREKKAIVTQIVLPLLLTLCGLLLARVTPSQEDDPARVLTLAPLATQLRQTNGYYADFRESVNATEKEKFRMVCESNGPFRK